MAEGVAHQAQERALLERRERRPWSGPQCDDGRRHAGRRPERARRNAADDARLGEAFHEDREVAALARCALVRLARGHPPCDLLLHENDDERRPPVVGEEALEERRRDLVREVGDDARRRAVAERVEVHGQRVGAHDAHVVPPSECLGEDRHHALVDLDRRDRARAVRERGGQDAGTGSDLEDVVTIAELGGVDDGRERGRIDEEALSDARRGAHAVAAQDRVERAGVREVHPPSLEGGRGPHLQIHCRAWFWLNIIAATFAFATGSNGLAPA